MNCAFNLTEAEMAYLSQCAKVRGISTTRLLERLVRLIARDQLVLSILDDGERPAPKRLPGEPTRSRFHRIPRPQHGDELIIDENEWRP